MDYRLWLLMLSIVHGQAAPPGIGDDTAIDELTQLREGDVLPNGDVDFTETLRQRRYGGSMGATKDPGSHWGHGMDEHSYPTEERKYSWGLEAERGGAVGGGGGGPHLPDETGPGSWVDGRTTPGATEVGRGGVKNKGGPSKGSIKEVSTPEENNGRRGRTGDRQTAPYQKWLQAQLLGQQLRPPLQGSEQIHLPAQYPRPPPPPPDYQQLKGRQFKPRLQKLDAYFGRLGVLSEDCRQRLLCEVAREPNRFFPLSHVLEDEAGFTGNYQYLTSQLINTTEGARLLSYMEANFRGQDRARTCDVFQLRCHSSTEDMINFQSLVVWREMIRWLTIHVLTRVP